jgi:uncharacterized cupredoxin-like copper-binding protein
MKGPDIMNRRTLLRTGVLLAAAGSLGAGALSVASFAHEGEAHFSAGEPGNPKRPARVVTISMHEGNGKMQFMPDKLEVRRGEQVRFVTKNDGVLEHEFMLATKAENAKHAELMMKYPDMEHDDPNGKRVKPQGTAEILWRFTKAGEFEYACLIPGHYQAGMFGKITVK